MRPPLLLVHGAFCGAWAWDALRRPWERAGFACTAPDLPGHAPGDSALAVAGRSLRDYADAVVEAARGLPAPPVIVGHSMGGLVAQIAAGRTPAAGLVLLAPSPAWGQTESAGMELAAGLALTALRGPWWLQALEPEWPVVRQFTMDRLPGPEARALFARMVPESGRAVFEITNWWLDPTFAAAAPTLDLPALVLVGEHDQVNPPSVAHATARRLRADCRTLPGRSHWLLGGDSGAEGAAGGAAGGVCETVLAWLARLSAPAAAGA